MSGYTCKQLGDVEESLKRIKAIGDLMSFAGEEGTGFAFPEDSMVQIGLLLTGWAWDALKILNPPEGKVREEHPQAAGLEGGAA